MDSPWAGGEYTNEKDGLPDRDYALVLANLRDPGIIFQNVDSIPFKF